MDTNTTAPSQKPNRCEALRRRGTGYRICDRPLDGHGNCDMAADHAVEADAR